jgi:hypothetical protein
VAGSYVSAFVRRRFGPEGFAYLRGWLGDKPLAAACARRDLERGELYAYVPPWATEEQLRDFEGGYVPGPEYGGEPLVVRDVAAELARDPHAVVVAEDPNYDLAEVPEGGQPAVGTPSIAAFFALPGASTEELVRVIDGPNQYAGGVIVVTSTDVPLRNGEQLTGAAVDQLARRARMLIRHAWDDEDYLVWRGPGG